MSSSAINPRDDLPDLLTRPPIGTREFVTDWSHAIIDPVRQLAALADLYADGLISRAEFERYKSRIRNL